MTVSKASMKKCLSRFLSVGSARVMLHQTLTFSPRCCDKFEAKRLLNRLLDNLEKRFEVASIYTREGNEIEGFHYHVLFFFFEEDRLPFAPSLMRKEFGKACFRAWDGLQSGRLVRAANATTEPKQRQIDYLLKGCEVAFPHESTERQKSNWWGCRNKRLLRKHSVEVDGEVLRYELSLKSKRSGRLRADAPTEKKYKLGDIRALKAELGFSGKASRAFWATYKMKKAGVGNPITDFAFLRFLNAEALDRPF